ncbi:class I SAM-dependent methyltransferase [Fundidesulfovibrio terrae]|uniref:class I SAM-dependent methyltransferase n=1 Tax=Fundidesulfovibrio terrae TaxID=2922866 RepID=UPI001FAF2D28|nr:class I SAM-dependent methyltransferase [Fundidesulfovibrio terrae]
MTQATRMDDIYRLQRHIYDATRHYYLLGRDRLLRGLPVPMGGAVLEVGCGTGRNLAALRKMRPDLTLCGLDVSTMMLETARAKLQGLDVTLACCRAEELDPQAHFRLDAAFDAVFFSYSLSMIPDWRAALEAGFATLKPGGTLAVVDFWGHGGLPSWLEWAHRRWLALFGVSFRPELLTYMRDMERQDRALLELESVKSGYAYLAWARKLG